MIMRAFSEKENQILKNIVDIIQQSEPNSLAELQVARLLRKELNFLALKWSFDPKDEVTIYIPKSNQSDPKKADSLYFEVADYIYFIEELESLGFVKLQNIPSEKKEDYTILYDRKEYTYDSEHNIFWQHFDDADINGKKVSGQALVSLEGWRTINTDFAKDLQHCALSIVYPLPLARSYVKNGFCTLEQIQYENQMRVALRSALYGRIAAIFGFISALAAIFTLCYTFVTDNKPTTIDRLDIERIESAIKSNHLSEPIEIMTGDTIMVKQVQSPNNTKSK